MNTLKLIPVFILACLSSSYATTSFNNGERFIKQLNSEKQEETTKITAVFTGMEDDEFVFTYTDEDGEDNTISFAEISPAAKEMYNLSSESFIGKKFEIIYSDENVDYDENDDTPIATNMIISLKQL